MKIYLAGHLSDGNCGFERERRIIKLKVKRLWSFSDVLNSKKYSILLSKRK